MGQPAFDPVKYTASSRDAWSEAARNFSEENAHRLEPYGMKLLEMLELDRVKTGSRLLDICSGPGEPALTLAERLGPKAHVTGSDFSPEMVRLATESAAGKNLKNVEFRECDAQQLPFESGSFDMVTCRFGLMLVAEPPKVAHEVERVLKKGGKFGFTVWAASEKNGPVWTIRKVMADLVPADLLPPMPDTHQWGDTKRIGELMDECELAVRKIEPVAADWTYPSAQEYWERMTKGSPMGRMLSKLPAGFSPKIESETIRRIGSLARPDGTLSLGAEALTIVAQKGMT